MDTSIPVDFICSEVEHLLLESTNSGTTISEEHVAQPYTNEKSVF